MIIVPRSESFEMGALKLKKSLREKNEHQTQVPELDGFVLYYVSDCALIRRFSLDNSGYFI